MSSSTGNKSNDKDQIRHWLSQAAELNEDGVYEMASGRSVQAIQCLENAVQLLMKVWDNASKEEEATNTASSGTPGSVVSSSHNVQVPYLQDEIFYIYPCAMTFSPSLTSAADLTLECTIVLFNLALAYHQRAKKQQQQEAKQNEEELLRQALAYYQECYQVLQSLQHQQEQHTSASTTATTTTTTTTMQEDWIVMITLAVMNNQAQIMYQLNTNSTTPSSSSTTASNTHPLFQKLWTESLSAILKSNSSSANSNDSSSSTDQEEDGHSCHYHNWSVVEESQLQEFVQNAMVFRLQRPCAAPTA